jgi:hypothetical protein
LRGARGHRRGRHAGERPLLAEQRVLGDLDKARSLQEFVGGSCLLNPSSTIAPLPHLEAWRYSMSTDAWVCRLVAAMAAPPDRATTRRRLRRSAVGGGAAGRPGRAGRLAGRADLRDPVGDGRRGGFPRARRAGAAVAAAVSCARRVRPLGLGKHGTVASTSAAGRCAAGRWHPWRAGPVAGLSGIRCRGSPKGLAGSRKLTRPSADRPTLPPLPRSWAWPERRTGAGPSASATRRYRQ